MARDVEALIVQLSADIKKYENAMNKAMGVTNKRAREVENRFLKMNKKLESSFHEMSSRLNSISSKAVSGFVTPLAGISAALSTREVLQYAEAWTKAKNSLSVAGVTGEQQAQVLQKLFDLSQKNAAPLAATVQLYGRASMASENLGASQADLVNFADAVGLALKVSGQDAEQASGALLQLSQVLGGSKVQAEEYNSLIDGLPTILQAAASGSDKWRGSISALTADVKAGKVSSQEFFRAILNGASDLQSRADAASQTVGQALTKIDNAFTRYIGSVDESLGTTQRLVAGLNALADNFNSTADTAVQLATVIGSALVGRAIGGMLATVPVAVSQITALVAAINAGTLGMKGFASALGPLGLLAGLAAGAAVAFGTFRNSIGDATRALAEQAAQGGAVEGMISQTKTAQEAYMAAVTKTAGAHTTASDSIVADTKREFEAKKALLELELKRQRALLAVQKADLTQKGAALKAEIGQQVFTRNSAVERGYSDPTIGDFVRQPDEITGLEKTREVIANSVLVTEIEKIRAEMALTEIGAKKLEDALTTTFSTGSGDGKGALSGADSSGNAKKAKAPKKTADDRFSEDLQAVRDRTAALIEEQQVIGQTYYEQEKRRMALDLEQQALRDVREEARKKGEADWQNAKLTPEQVGQINTVSEAYAKQADVLRDVEEAQLKAESSAQEFYDTAKSGFVDVLKGTESLSDALSKLADKLADLALNSVFDDIFGGMKATSSGGWLTNIFKGLGFADGGYTGAGGKYQPAGVVHRGEYVFDQDSVRAAGGPAALDAMRRGLKGYAGGGYVAPIAAPRLPDMSNLRRSQQAASGPATIAIDVTGATGNAEVQQMVAAGVQQGISAYDKQMPGRVQQINKQPRYR